MARTINEIQQVILAEKASHEELDVLDSTSKVSIWRLWIYITAFVIWSLEMIFDTHKAEVSSMIAELKPHTARWYRNKALAFQFGFALLPDSDIFDNEGHTDEEIEASKIVKYSAVVEAENESRLVIKIAGESAGVLSKIDDEQQEAFEKYIKEIRDAGVLVTIINYLPDRLYLNITIKRNPLVLDSEGTSFLAAKKPVEETIAAFLKYLPLASWF